jgi:hypothetical protein
MEDDMANNGLNVTVAITRHVIAGLDPAIHRYKTSSTKINRHSGAREARTRNLEIPGLVLRTIPE